MAERRGGCLCGAVRYVLDSEPTMTAVCHCTHCQKQSGAPFSANLIVPDAAYHQTGETKVFTDRGDSGQTVERHFCPACGSPIVSRPAIMSGMTVVKVGTLDDMSGLTPAVEVYTDHAVAWHTPIVGAHRFAQGAG